MFLHYRRLISKTEGSERDHNPGYRIVGGLGCRVYGVSTCIRQNINKIVPSLKRCDGDIFIVAVNVFETIMINVCTPPNLRGQILPTFEHPAVYDGDINSHYSEWGYSSDNNNDIGLPSCAENNTLFF